MNELNGWRTEIRPSEKKIEFNFKEIWAYRDLILLFVKREFISKYKQTILGPLWAVIQPLLTTVVFTIIFGSLAKLTTADTYTVTDTEIPSFMFYMLGTIVWTYFSTTLQQTSNTFISNMSLMGKVYYPRMVTPISSAISNLISFAIQMALYIVIVAGYCISKGGLVVKPSVYICLLPLLIVQMMMLSVGVGIIVSSLTTKYRDLTMLVGFGLELWKYGTPVAYGLTLIPQKWLPIYLSNPVTTIVTTIRYAFLGFGYFELKWYLLSWLITIILFLWGLVMFNKIEKTFADTV